MMVKHLFEHLVAVCLVVERWWLAGCGVSEHWDSDNSTYQSQEVEVDSPHLARGHILCLQPEPSIPGASEKVRLRHRLMTARLAGLQLFSIFPSVLFSWLDPDAHVLGVAAFSGLLTAAG